MQQFLSEARNDEEAVYDTNTQRRGVTKSQPKIANFTERGLFRQFLTILVLTGFLMFPARDVRAGFFDSLKRLFLGDDPIETVESSAAAISLPLLGSQNTLPLGIGGPVNSGLETNLSVTQDSALVANSNPAGILPPPETGQIVVYTVVAGDTPSSIAERFGISLNTLLWANDIRNARSIKTGDSLVILPVSGVRYEVKKGDTVGSIAKKFKPKNEEDFDSFINDILSYNGLSIDEKLETGREIIIPEGEVNIPSSPARPRGIISRFANLPEFIGYYLRPILGGRKSQGIHGYNGMDLANSCGFPVFASAPGQVIISKSSGWNTGYGKYAAISHSNNTQSLYAHMGKVFVQIGQVVNQGETIGLIGSTGRSTGCHLHFEIRGARNPF